MQAEELQQRRQREAAAIENCEDEAIEAIGTIQTFGSLVGLDPTLTEITHASANLEDEVGVDASWILGRSAEVLFGAELMHRMRNAAGLRTIRSHREYLGRQTVAASEVDVAVHAVEGTFIVEMQAAADVVASPDAFGLVRQAMAQVDLEADVEQVLLDAVHPLRALSGFDRVMAYRFAPDGSGEIVAESRRVTVDSFLGLHFPGFDIPQAARRLYASTPIRTISDVDAVDHPILVSPTAGGDAADLDLGLAVLRGIPEVHTQYLRNMGVRSTMSLPIVVDGELWGLFSFHHHEPRPLSAGLLMACEVTGRTLSLGIDRQVRHQRWTTSSKSVDLVAALVVQDDGSAGIGVTWDSLSRELVDVLPCDGVALLLADQLYVNGNCPDEAVIRTVAGQLGTSDRAVTVDDLIDRFADLDLGTTAGAAVVNSGGAEPISIVFFRELARRSVRWAGNPQKRIEEVADELRLHPRSSFESYVESLGNRSRAWEGADVLAADGLHAGLVSALRIRRAAHAHSERMGLVVRELNHRVRNLLALVQSLAVQTRDSSTGLDDYAEGLQDRLALLASAHDLLTERQWGAVDLETLFERTGAPFAVGDNLELDGPEVLIDPSVVSIISLMIHELFSNAARHGALSVPTGVVRVSWTLDDSWLRLAWVEVSGPPVAEPVRSGFGTVILAEAVPFELEGQATLDFPSSGLEAMVSIPARLVASPDALEEDEVEGDATDTTDTPPDDRNRRRGRLADLSKPVLVVEDDFLVSRETVRLLHEFGCESVAAAATADQALQAMDKQDFAFALLDVNLRGEFSGGIALRLRELGVPFAFVTGYGAEASLDSFNVPIVQKPINRKLFHDCVVELASKAFEGER